MSTIASKRYTTSSRRPGVSIEGTVRVRQAPLITCPRCGGRTTVEGPRHGVHWSRLPCGHHGLKNCIGEQLELCTDCEAG